MPIGTNPKVGTMKDIFMSPVLVTKEDLQVLILFRAQQGVNFETKEAVEKGTSLLPRTNGHHLLIIEEPPLLLVHQQQAVAVGVDRES